MRIRIAEEARFHFQLNGIQEEVRSEGRQLPHTYQERNVRDTVRRGRQALFRLFGERLGPKPGRDHPELPPETGSVERDQVGVQAVQEVARRVPVHSRNCGAGSPRPHNRGRQRRPHRQVPREVQIGLRQAVRAQREEVEIILLYGTPPDGRMGTRYGELETYAGNVAGTSRETRNVT